MARKPKKATTALETEKSRKQVAPESYWNAYEERGRSFARIINSPEFAADRIIRMAQPKALAEELHGQGLMDILVDMAAAVQGGDLGHAEAMLVNQASALQALFVRLSESAMEQSYMGNFEGYMRMALRAQSQCRATLETLAAIKNPPVVYARQANVTTGPQQINNGTAPPSHAREIQNSQTQLSGGNNELLPDGRASGNEIRVDPALETLGEIDRAKVPRG